MKKNMIKNILCFCILVIANKQAWSKIITVDNTAGTKAHATSIQFAIDSLASAGDTIIVMPSYLSYYNVAINKRVFMYAGGHSNATVNKDKKALIASLDISGVNASRTSVLGFEISSLSIQRNADYNRIINNKINSISLSNSSYNLIQGNVIILLSRFGFALINITQSNYNLISNNFMQLHEFVSNLGNLQGVSFIFGGNSSNLVINNNFTECVSGNGNIGRGIWFFNNTRAKIHNNIIWTNVNNRLPIDSSNLGSDFKNNITYSVNTTLKNLPGNNFNDTAVAWEGNYSSTNLPFFRPGNLMKLKSTSVGYAQGTDSTQIGIYGQNYNFSFEGDVPGVAIFEDFQVLKPVIKRGEKLKVKVKARKPQDN